MRRIFAPLAALGLLVAANAYAEDTLSPLKFQSEGVLGSYDVAALQRGFLVYQTVCASCHSMNALHYRDLEALGFTTDQVAGVAAGVKLKDGSAATLNDMFKDPHVSPAAFGGAVPPDLSNMVNERPKGLHYVYDLLTGYGTAPADVTMLQSRYYNTAYPGNQIAMPAPLKGHEVSYSDGTAATQQQEAVDVTAYLAWAADPNLDTRREIGLRAILFLVFLTVIAIATKRRVWRETL